MSLTAAQRQVLDWQHKFGTPEQRAIAQHLAEVEKLLAEMYAEWLRLVGPEDNDLWRDWHKRIVALLEGREP